MSINLDILARTYFWFDEPVPYKVKQGEVLIKPIRVKDSEMFLSWVDLLTIDKNSLPNPDYISMSYLEFIVKALMMNEHKEESQVVISKLVCLLKLCLGWDGEIGIQFNERNKPYLIHGDIEINGKQFEDIRRIILYQNILDYDDSYINPDVKQAISDVEEMKHKNIETPTLERRMAIITAHSGVLKKDQMEMTYRSHSALFKEVYGEVDYLSVRTGVMVGNMFSKQKIELDDWVYKKKHNKYEQYFTSQDDYSKSMGGSNYVRSNDGSVEASLAEFNSLIK